VGSLALPPVLQPRPGRPHPHSCRGRRIRHQALHCGPEGLDIFSGQTVDLLLTANQVCLGYIRGHHRHTLSTPFTSLHGKPLLLYDIVPGQTVDLLLTANQVSGMHHFHAWYATLQCTTVLVPYCTLLWSAVNRTTAVYSAVNHSTVMYSTGECNEVQCMSPLTLSLLSVSPPAAFQGCTGYAQLSLPGPPGPPLGWPYSSTPVSDTVTVACHSIGPKLLSKGPEDSMSTFPFCASPPMVCFLFFCFLFSFFSPCCPLLCTEYKPLQCACQMFLISPVLCALVGEFQMSRILPDSPPLRPRGARFQ